MRAWSKGIVSWQKDGVLYLSVPFTWLMPKARRIEEAFPGRVVIGGPGTMKPSACLDREPIALHNPDATFTTRGCPNRCAFCAVPRLEGDFREIPDFRPAPIVCDNNLLAASRRHLERVVDKLKAFPEVDFNQGLDARRFNREIADLLAGLKCKVRFAFDHIDMAGAVKAAIDLCRERTTKNIGIYVLIGFNDTPAEAISRLELVRSWGIRPNPMRYQPLDAVRKNAYIGPGWTRGEMERIMRYYSRLRYLEHIPFSEYRYTRRDKGQGALFREAI